VEVYELPAMVIVHLSPPRTLPPTVAVTEPAKALVEALVSIALEPEAPAVETAVKAGPVMLSKVCVVPARQLPSGWKVPVHALNRTAGSQLTVAACAAAA